MALIIYGSPRSRTLRVLWAAAELGLDYQHIPLEADDPALKGEYFLRLNPAGAIPTIVDDGFALSESMAINLYLAKTYGGAPFYPVGAQEEADAWRWSLWAQGALEPWVQRDGFMSELREVAGDVLAARSHAGLAVLERALSQRAWLIGDHFTVADLNVAGVLSPSRAAQIDFASAACTREWLARCYGRPAALAARAKFQL